MSPSVCQRCEQPGDGVRGLRLATLGELLFCPMAQIRDDAKTGQPGVALDRVEHALARDEVAVGFAVTVEQVGDLVEEGEKAAAIGHEPLHHGQQLGALRLLAGVRDLFGDVVDDDEQPAHRARAARLVQDGVVRELELAVAKSQPPGELGETQLARQQPLEQHLPAELERLGEVLVVFPM